MIENTFKIVITINGTAKGKYGGMVITGAAAKLPDRLKSLVYLDAYIPEDGQTETELWPAEMRDAIEKEKTAGMGLRESPSPEFLGITDPDMDKAGLKKAEVFYGCTGLTAVRHSLPGEIEQTYCSFSRQQF